MNDQRIETQVDAVATWLRDRTGMSFVGARGGRLREQIGRILADDPSRVADDGVEESLLLELVEALTVQESNFFREPAKLALVRDHVLPDLAARPRRLRVWSAGCAGGEEVYTLAALFDRAGLGDRVHLLGTDLSASAVADAREGRYTNWSVRGLAPADLVKLFTSRDAAHRVIERLRRSVQFEVHNLLDPRPAEWGRFDLVVCRNVLIYFTPDGCARAAGALVDALAPGGWLVLGSSDPLLEGTPGLETVVTEHGLAYRRTDAATTAPTGTGGSTDVAADIATALDQEAATPAIVEPRPARRRARAAAERESAPAAPAAVAGEVSEPGQVVAAAREELARARPDRAERLVRGVASDAPGTPAPGLVLGEALAQQGRLAEAAALARRLVTEFPDDAEPRHLLAVLLLESGDAAEAARAAREAVYLDPSCAPAHLVLARCRELLGDDAGARRSRRVAQRLIPGGVG